jgi:hypothetical protein
MIKLTDILQEIEKGVDVFKDNLEDHSNMHYRDHVKAIIEHAEKALATSEPKIMHSNIAEILKHAESAHNKIYNNGDTSGVHSGGGHVAGFHANNADF